MASSKFVRGSNAIVFTVLAVGILVLINVVASRSFGRIDLTAARIYTISPASKTLVASLPDRLSVKAFISSDLPPMFADIARYVRDILEEYATASKGRMVWEVIDPRDEKAKEEARRLQVTPKPLSEMKSSKLSLTESYLGVAFQYGGKVEALPFIADMGSLEYYISSTIRRLTGKKRKVGFTTGHGEPAGQRGLRHAREELNTVEVTDVDPTEGKTPIPADIDVLVMVGPAQPLAERAKWELDQFLMKGKGLALLIDGMVLETPRGQMPAGKQLQVGRPNDVGLKEQLEHYGLRIRDDLVMDRQSHPVVMNAGQDQRVMVRYPGFPMITNLSRNSVITRDLQGFVPFWASSIELMPSVQSGKGPVTATVLATCSPGSWRHTGFYVFDPLREQEPTKDLGPFNIAYLLQGRFPSYYAGRPVPEPGPAQRGPSPLAQQPPGKGQTSPANTRLVVVSDSDFIKDNFLGVYPSNMALLLNIVDYLAEDESLIAIRAKGQTQRPLRAVEEGTITLVKYGNIIGLPALLIGFGLVRWRVRRARRERRASEVRKA